MFYRNVLIPHLTRVRGITHLKHLVRSTAKSDLKPKKTIEKKKTSTKKKSTASDI